MQTVSGQNVPADLVIYATGYDREYDYLTKDVLEALHQTDEGIPLYRDTVPTDIDVSNKATALYMCSLQSCNMNAQDETCLLTRVPYAPQPPKTAMLCQRSA